MTEAGAPRALTGWQRLHVLAAARYVGEIAARTPGDEKARAVFEGLLDVLEPTRRVARQYRNEHQAGASHGSMWEQRSGRDRRVSDRRTTDAAPPAGGDRRKGQRRSGRDRRRETV